MIVIFEMDARPTKPGKFRSVLGGRRFFRVWFLWWAVAIWPGDLKEYHQACKDGVWID